MEFVCVVPQAARARTWRSGRATGRRPQVAGQQRERRTTGEVLHELVAIEASMRLESVLVRMHALQAARCMHVPLLKVENYICH